jgi:hypothetical protein
MIGAGDIGMCNATGDDSTAAIVDSVLKADSVAKVEDVVFSIGDHAYESGTKREFDLCWGGSWGDSTKRIMKEIRPTPGNHEYESAGAAPYFKYFGARAGDPQKGYYAYDLGEWRVIVLNSEIPMNSLFSMEDSAQEDWLRAEFRDPPGSARSRTFTGRSSVPDTMGPRPGCTPSTPSCSREAWSWSCQVTTTATNDSPR